MWATPQLPLTDAAMREQTHLLVGASMQRVAIEKSEAEALDGQCSLSSDVTLPGGIVA
jgi:hypothetical protein